MALVEQVARRARPSLPAPRLADPQPADESVAPSAPRLPFRYRSVLDSFSVYGYDVSVRRKAREFLELRDVGERRSDRAGIGRGRRS